jgi:hypothetical protein
LDLSNIALNVGRTTKITGLAQPTTNIIEFVEEAPWGLNMKLFPVQRVILKAHYGIKLDNTKTFEITDWRRQSKRQITEVDYLKMLFAEGRSNIETVIEGDERRELILSLGRRSGKTLLAAAVAAYETYKLLLKGDPKAYYGLSATSNIQIISVATDKDQAGILYTEVSGHFRSCGFFSPYTANNTMSYARFQTPKDIEKFGRYADDPNAKASIRVTFRSCIAKGLRGVGNIVVILDEMAHFTDKGQSSAADVYNAVSPSTSTFSPKDPNNHSLAIGNNEGRILSISSPLGRQGQFYKLFQIAMKGGEAGKTKLAIQAPTWEVNPSVPASEFETKYLSDPVVFFTEFGAEFTDRTKGWIERESDLMACVHPNNRPIIMPAPRTPHFVGVDVGLVGDASAIAVGHINENAQIVLDYIDKIHAGYGDFANVERLDFDAVADWVFKLSRKYYMVKGMFDHWAGIPFQQALEKRGLKQLESVQMTKPLISEIWVNFKNMLFDKRLVLYDWPLPQNGETRHCEYIQELLELQAEYQSKYVITVSAPNTEGKHDDLSDALSRMIWCASQNLGKMKYVTGAVMSPTRGSTSDSDYRRAFVKARRMGTSPDRRASRNRPGFISGRR